MAAAESVYSYTVRDIFGKEKPLGDVIGGKVALIVNVASKCGFTPQYEGLEDLHRRLGPRGFVVLGCPCNQFGSQEPGSEEDIHKFACERFKATFPLTSKMDVNGDKAHPLWSHMKKAVPGILGTEGIKWNFTKFLVDRTGRVRARFGPMDTPVGMEAKIVEVLGESA